MIVRKKPYPGREDSGRGAGCGMAGTTTNTRHHYRPSTGRGQGESWLTPLPVVAMTMLSSFLCPGRRLAPDFWHGRWCSGMLDAWTAAPREERSSAHRSRDQPPLRRTVASLQLATTYAIRGGGGVSSSKDVTRSVTSGNVGINGRSSSGSLVRQRGSSSRGKPDAGVEVTMSKVAVDKLAEVAAMDSGGNSRSSSGRDS